MAEKIRERLIKEIADLCFLHGCDEKTQKVHTRRYVDGNWCPHPPETFVKWWRTQPDYGQGVDAVRAFNCEPYRIEFRAQKAEIAEFGLPKAPKNETPKEHKTVQQMTEQLRQKLYSP